MAPGDTNPGTWAYESFRLEDDVAFVDIVAGHRPRLLSELTTWAPYRSNLDARCDHPPVLETLTRDVHVSVSAARTVSGERSTVPAGCVPVADPFAKRRWLVGRLMPAKLGWRVLCR